MEFSDSQKNKNGSFLKSFILTSIGILLIILIFIYLIYILERYILYFSIYSFLKLLLSIYISSEKIKENKNIFFCALIICIFLHIKLFQIIIISFTFLAGGIFSRFYFYYDFIKILEEQIDSCKEINSCLYFSIKRNMLNYYYNNICRLKNALNNLKVNKHLEIKNYNFTEKLNNIIYLFEKYKEKNYEDENIKNNLMNKIKSYQKDIIPHKEYNFIDIIFKFDYSESKSLLQELFINSFNNRICNNIIISEDFDAYI